MNIASSILMVNDSRVQSNPEPFYLWEFSGQSNCGSTQSSEAPVDLQGDLLGCYIWNFNAVPAAWQPYNIAVNSRCFPGEAAGGLYGPEARFMKLMQAHTGHNQYCIKYGKGATGLIPQGGNDDWSPSTNELYLASTNNHNAALAALGNGRQLTAYVWIQGEREANNGQYSIYQAPLQGFKSAKRASYSQPLMTFIIQRLGNLQNLDPTGLAAMRGIQQTVGSEAQSAWYSADGASVDVGLVHYDPDGQDLIGTNLYNVALGFI